MSGAAALVLNASGRTGRLAIEALASMHDEILAVAPSAMQDAAAPKAVEWLDSECLCEADWQRIEAALTGLRGKLATIVQCPVEGDGPEVAQDQIRSAWLASKNANRLLAGVEPHFLILLRQSEGGDAVDRAAARDGIIVASRSAQLDAFKTGVFLRSNRIVISLHSDDAQCRQTIAALLDDRGSFVSGADIRVDSPKVSGAADRLDDRAFLVTGATSGIGRATAIEIGRKGGWVAVAGRKPDLGEETLAAVRAAGGDGMFVRLDVTEPEAWRDALAMVMEARGALHGLVNNAGEAKNAPIADLSEDTVRFLVGLNYGGCRLGMTSALESLARSGGAIVNVASVAGMRAGYGGSAYGASKAAMLALSTSFAREVAAPRGVRVNCIQPGLIWSESVADALGEEDAARFREMIEARTPIGRVGAPEEVGRFIAFLLSDAAGGISGQAIPVSGGLELLHP